MRRWLISLGIVGAAMVAALALLPWWLGAALAMIGPRFGLTIQRYERDGYSRFSVQGAEYRRGPVRVTVDRATASTPLVWLAKRTVGRADRIVVGRWLADVERGDRSRPRRNAPGWVPLRAQLTKVADRLALWLPTVEAAEGSVRWWNGTLSFGPARWENRTLRASRVGYRGLSAAVEARFPVDGTIDATARDEQQALAAELRGEGDAISGQLSWAGQPATLRARFPAVGWRPAEAHLQAADWNLPAERARLGRQYVRIRGGGTADWDGQALAVALYATGEPREGTAAPPLTVNVRGRSRAGEFVAEVVDVKLPGVTALLSEPIAIDRTGRLRSEASRFTFDVRLEEQPWFPARGVVRGEGRIAAGEQGLVAVTYTAGGDGLSVRGLDVAQAQVRGGFEWPELRVDRLEVRGPDGTAAWAEGTWNVTRRELLGGRAGATLARGSLAPWLPATMRIGDLRGEVTASGRWPEIRHHGRTRASALELPRLAALDVEAEWSGTGRGLQAFEVRADGSTASLRASGSADAAGLQLDRLELRSGSRPPLGLAQPTRIHWAPDWRAEPVRLAGGGMRVDASGRWGTTGEIDLRVERMEAEWLRGWLTFAGPAWTVERLRLQGRWDAGPAVYQSDAVIVLPLGSGHAASVSAQLVGTERGLDVRQLRVEQGAGVIATASGRLPVVVQPASRPLVRVQTNGEFTLDAETTANPEFWSKLTDLAGVEVANPEASVHLTGSLEEPRGEARLRASRLAPVPGRFQWKWPQVENVDVRVTGDRGGLRLDAFSVTIDGQLVQADGWVPVAAADWAGLIRDPRRVAEKGDLHVRVPGAQLSAIASYVPAYLAPAGQLEADVRLKSDQTIQGFIRVTNAASRPLGPLGVLQEVNADVRFEGRRIRLQEVTARMAGQRVQLKGQADLPAYETPRLNFTLQGENLPFVRRTGLLVRGDLDLTLQTQADGQTEIGGEVRLRDSLFLSDVRSFLPNGAKGTTLQPPYFTIDFAPLNTWRLSVLVRGDKFIRLRTPVFNGTASTHIQLLGVLGNPRALGEAVIDEGTIRLPFASFDVKQGEVRLTAEKPEPQLMIIGTTRRHGYDLRLELTGAASSPSLTFSSSPPLESEQVLLMVMAGQAPRNEVVTTDRQRAARFGAFFGQSLLGSLSGSTGGADRLTISSGEDISAQGRETYNIEYKLNNRWSLTGEYDEFDEYYAGVKVRVYQKGGRKDQ